jgi:hypothetical protein
VWALIKQLPSNAALRQEQLRWQSLPPIQALAEETGDRELGELARAAGFVTKRDGVGDVKRSGEGD